MGLNNGASNQERLTIEAFGSIVVQEPLEHDHEAGEPISLLRKAPLDDDQAASQSQGDDTNSNNNGATVAIVVVVIVIVLLVAGGGVAPFFILKMRRQGSSGGNMTIRPRGNKAITIASTDDMNSPTYDTY